MSFFFMSFCFQFCEWKCFISLIQFFFVKSSWYLRWLEKVFPNSNRLFSQIPLPSPPPPDKMSNWITQFHLIVMPHTLFRISVFWSKPEWESFDFEGRKLSFERFEYTCSWWELKKTVSSFLKNLNSRGKIILIMNQLKIANCSKVNLSYSTCIKFWTF